MKKITLFILTIFTVATLYAAARPSLDGRAVVAESGTMPRGLFARTVGYLPGDSVTVTNPATGSTVDVLVLGAIDPSEGVAILLSPEAAESLRIKPNSNVQVKLTKRTGSLDENANGSAVLSEGEDEEEEAPRSPAIAENTDSYREETPRPYVNTKKEIHRAEIIPTEDEASSVAANETEPYEEIPAVAETPAVSERKPPYEEVPAVAETPVIAKSVPVPVEEPYDEDADIKTVYEELPPLPQDKGGQRVVVIETEPSDDSDVSEERVIAEEKPFVAEKVSEERVLAEPVETAETPELADSDELVSEEQVFAEKVAEEKVPAECSPEERVERVIVEVIPALETVTEEKVRENPPIAEQDAEPENVIAEEPSPFYEELPVGIESEPSVVVEAYDEYDETEETDAYQPIILVPADLNPPVAEDTSDSDYAEPEESEQILAGSEEELLDDSAEAAALALADEDSDEQTELALAPVASEPEAQIVETEAPAEQNGAEKPAQPAKSTQAVENDWTNYVVPSVKNLRSGSYYIQVASLGNAENIKSFVEQYSETYPLVLVQTSSKNAYQVMVGPLSIDEYGSVDEKFKSYGFKDSFVRKIN